MTDCHHADGVVVAQLIDDAVRAYTQRPQALQPSPQAVAGLRLTFQEPDGLQNGAGERVVEGCKGSAGRACRDHSGHYWA